MSQTRYLQRNTVFSFNGKLQDCLESSTRVLNYLLPLLKKKRGRRVGRLAQDVTCDYIVHDVAVNTERQLFT